MLTAMNDNLSNDILQVKTDKEDPNQNVTNGISNSTNTNGNSNNNNNNEDVNSNGNTTTTGSNVKKVNNNAQNVHNDSPQYVQSKFESKYDNASNK